MFKKGFGVKSIKDVLNNKMCSGCGLCSELPNKMQISSEGFLRPTEPIEDEISLTCCPGIKVQQNQKDHYDLVWGPILASYTGFSSDSNIRNMGSSGGVLTSLLKFLLENKLVDGVIQVGVSDTNPLQNRVVVTTVPDDLVQNAGSRYSPSSPLSMVRSLMGNNKKYAVVAKPCDIAALRSLIESDEVIKKQYPVLLSFMCAGIPSEKATYDVLEKLKVDAVNVKTFRYRGDGWPGLTTAVDLSGQPHSMTYNESWGTILNRKLQVRCKFCADGTGELADIVCADAWYESKDGYPSFEEKLGRSLILARNKHGLDVLNQSVLKGFVTIEGGFPVKELLNIQPYQAKRKKTMLVRIFALKLFGVKTTKFYGFNLVALTMRTSPILLFKMFIGTFVRKLKGRL